MKEVQLREVVDVYDNLRKPLSTMTRLGIQGKYPYYSANGAIDSINKFIFSGEYILVAEDGSVRTDDGKPVVKLTKKDEQFWVSNHAHVLRAKEGILNKYLYYNLSQININQIITGAVQLKVSQENLLKLKVKMHSSSEQRHIVDTIGSVDDLMEKNTKIITKLSFLTEKTIELVPRKSTLKPLSYFCYSIICGTTPSTKNRQFWMGNIPFITLEDISDLPFVTSSQRKISEECFIKCNRQLHEEDIITSCIGTVGKVAMVSCDCQTNQQINAVNPIPKYRYYLYEELKKKKAELLLLSKSGSATPNINKNTFSNICFAIPNDCELDKINSALSLIFKKILVLQKENDTLRKQKNVLLAKYFG